MDRGQDAIFSIHLCHEGLSWGIYFTAYNNAKQRWQMSRNETSLPAPLNLLSAAEAGCVVGTFAWIRFP
jgi:hypothetical protein